MELTFPPHNKTGRHGDYYDENILMSPEKVSAIDFGLFSYGTPIFDVAKFIVSLDLYRYFRYNKKFFQSLANTFLKTYNKSNKIVSISDEALRLYKIVVLLHELKWSELFETDFPSNNPFIRYTVGGITKYSVSEIRNFVEN